MQKRITSSQHSKNISEALEVILGSPNVASREPLVRYYDHEVQAATRVNLRW